MIFGNLGNMGELMKQAKKMQEDLKKVKAELATELFSVEKNGVRVEVSGDMEVKEVKIDPSAKQPDKIGRLDGVVKEVTNEAMKKSKDYATHKLKGLTGGLNIPGLF
ncbi:MAG: YbaB/EbfC family nucleoid-associated protein [Candidatus Saganbacteria bacterium]|nr:YbaB/EbfC family nucleoid-associated protein [Candidatus Saganbacteria bacterium]